MTSRISYLKNHWRGAVSGAAIVAVTGVALFGGMSAQAENATTTEDEMSVAALYDGYKIVNDTGENLTLESTSQSSDAGWGVEPPKLLEAGKEYYFEVKYWWAQFDGSKLLYTNSDKTYTAYLYANQDRSPLWYTINDASRCSWWRSKPSDPDGGYRCVIDNRATKLGEQTVFSLFKMNIG